MKMLSNGNVQGKHNNVHTDTNEKTLALEKHRISTTMSTLTQMVAYMKNTGTGKVQGKHQKEH